MRHRLFLNKRLNKYTLYAIGEIVLVVIGILIALQINTWNDQRKDKLHECNYYKSLTIDLKNQLQVISSQMNFELEVINSSENLLKKYYANNQFLVDDDFSRQINTLNNRMTFRTSSTTYQDLLSTGNMNIILNDSIKKSILNFYEALSQYADIISKNNSYIDNHFAPLILEISTHSNPNHQIDMFQNIIKKGLISERIEPEKQDLSSIYSLLQTQLDDPLKQLNLLNQVKYRYRISGVHLTILDILEEQIGQLIGLLDSQISICSTN